MKGILIFLGVFLVSNGKVFERCELAKALLNKYGVPKSQVATYVCIAFRESSYNTNRISSTSDYGIFQINSQYWCSKDGKPKTCGITCGSLLDDDISNDVKCAKLIQSQQGFKAWATFKFCQTPDSYISGCF